MMRFAVAQHYLRTPEFWMSHNGWPIMALGGPSWARHLTPAYNLGLFAPTWEMVKGVKYEGLPVEEYTRQFRALMQARLPAIRRWLADPKNDGIILLCACPEGRFCHRHLVAKLLVWLGAEQMTLTDLLETYYETWRERHRFLETYHEM